MSNIDYVRIRYSLLQRVKWELDSLPECLALEPGTLVEDPFIDICKPLWCKCINKEYHLQGEGDSRFLVNAEGLIIPPHILCTLCTVRKSSPVQFGTRSFSKYKTSGVADESGQVT